MEFVVVLLLILVFVYLVYNQIMILYFRYFKSFDKEIETFLKLNNYKLLEKRNPNKEDWKSSPFNKPDDFKVNIVVVRINSLPVTWTVLKYMVILLENENKKIWMESKTTYFRKPKIKFIVN